MTKRNASPFHTGKSSAQRHADRIARDAKHAKPEFDPKDTARWINKHGRFTIPHTKEQRK